MRRDVTGNWFSPGHMKTVPVLELHPCCVRRLSLVATQVNVRCISQ